MEISNEDLEELLDCISSLADMMEPYYKQCNGDDEAQRILEKYRLRRPYTSVKVIPASCKICGKTFLKSSKKRLLDASQQNAALCNHMISAHGLEDHKDRKKFMQKSDIVTTQWGTYKEYLDSLVQEEL